MAGLFKKVFMPFSEEDKNKSARMAELSERGPADDIERAEVEVFRREKQVAEIVDRYDESTGTSWLWAFLFGPLYFGYHGMWLWAAGTFLLAVFTGGLGILVFPFLARPAWRSEAKKRAEKVIAAAASPSPNPPPA